MSEQLGSEQSESAEETGLPVSVAALSPAARRVHLAVLTTFADTAAPPSPDELRQLAAAGADPDEVLTELAERDVTHVDESGAVTASYPFSTTPTRHLVSWSGGPTVYSMCAIDALGMSAMLDRPVTITSSEPGTDQPVVIEVDGDHAVWDPPTTVVFIGSIDTDCTSAAERLCRFVNFFTTSEAAEQWSQAHPEIDGYVLEQHKALKFAVKQFGDLLRS